MKPEDLVSELVRSCRADRQRYRGYLTEESGDDSCDCLRSLFHTLSAEQQSAFWAIVDIVQSDSVVSVLDLIDNQAFPECQEEDLELRHGDDVINGDLMDLFLAEGEEECG